MRGMITKQRVWLSIACAVCVAGGLFIMYVWLRHSIPLLPSESASRAEIARHFATLVMDCRTEKECASKARAFAAAINDAETLTAMARLSTEMGSVPQKWYSQLPREIGLSSDLSRWEACHEGWSQCVYRLGAMGTTEAAESLVCILTNDYNGEEGALILGDTLVKMGTPALPALSKVQGEKAFLADEMVECIKTGKSFW